MSYIFREQDEGLSRCPFCGGLAEYNKIMGNNPNLLMVKCTRCKAAGTPIVFHGDENEWEKAKVAWNTRVKRIEIFDRRGKFNEDTYCSTVL